MSPWLQLEILATWYRTPKWEFQKSAGGGAGKNGGAGQSAGTGAGRSGPLGKQRQNGLPAPVPALRPAPPFLPPALFWNSHFSEVSKRGWREGVGDKQTPKRAGLGTKGSNWYG